MQGTHRYTINIMLGMFLGVLVGLAIRWIPLDANFKDFVIDKLLGVGGEIFLRLIQLLVIPIVLISLILGSSSLGNFKQLGRVGGKSVLLYLMTTALAVTLALLVASFFQVGHGLNLTTGETFVPKKPPMLTQVLINMVPSNPFHALTQGNMLQIIVFSLLFGVSITAVGKPGELVAKVVESANEVLLKLILLIMKTVPIGVFFLLARLFATIGFEVFAGLLGYFFMVLFVLALQLLASYSAILFFVGRLNPVIFFRKMYSAMLFAFSVSSSTASIPIVLETVERRLGVKNSVASFIIPLGATVNMDGTAIMQGVATVFIANAYHINIGFSGYLLVILMATLASIGTAGVPSVGLVTLSLVLRQVGLPVQGIMLIIGIDRLLDMARTAVNIAGDSMIASVVAKSEGKLSKKVYQQ